MGFVTRETEYYKYGTEIDANVVGSFARIENGVASGFMTGTFLRLLETIEVGSNTWESVIKITTGSDISTDQTIWGTIPDYKGALLRLNGGGALWIYLSSNGSSWDITGGTSSSLKLAVNTTYYIKTSFNGSQYLVDVSTNGIDYTNYITFNSSTPLIANRLTIGGHGVTETSFDTPFLGSVDLSESYIKVGDEAVWDGTYYYTNGTWINEGVVGWFTSSNWLSLPSTIAFGSNAWEIGLKFRTGSTVIKKQRIFNSQTDRNGTMFLIDENGNFEWRVNVDDWVKHISSFIVSADTVYWVKLKFNGISYVMSYSTDGIDYIDDITIESSQALTIVGYNIGASETSAAREPFDGVIDLNKCYIKIGNSVFWHGTKAYRVNLGGENVYKDWTQPVLTSNNSYGVITGNSYYSESDRNFFRISDGKIPTANDGADNWGTSNSSVGWWLWKLPVKLKITGIKIYNRSHTSAVDYQLTGARFYTDDTKTTPIGEEFSITTSQGIYELTTIPEEGIVTDKIYFYKTGNTYSGIGELEITAQELVMTGGDSYDFVKYQMTDHEIMSPGSNSAVITIDNYNVNGSWGRINSNIANGFSASTFLKTPEDFNPSTSPWEVCTKFKKTASGDLTIFGMGTTDQRGATVYVNSSNLLSLAVSYSSSWSIVESSFYTIENNLDYWVKCSFTGEAYVLDVSMDGVEYENILHVESSSTITTFPLPVNFGARHSAGGSSCYPFTGGLIDLSQTRISIDGDLWWNGSNYVKVGSWIEEDVVGTFTSSNYLSLPTTFKPENKPWEMCFKIHTPVSYAASVIFGKYSSNTYYGLRLELATNGNIYYLVSGASGTTYIFEGYGNNTYPLDSDVYVKFSFLGDKYIAYISIDNGLTWLLDKEFVSSTPLFAYDSASTIGYSLGVGLPLAGCVYLNESYIKIDGKDWWRSKRSVSQTQGSINWNTLLSTSVAGSYDVEIPDDCVARVTLVGGGGAAAMRGQYDDRGYGWSGGSGGAFEGDFILSKGVYTVVVGSANNNTLPQGGNSNTMNPPDATAHDSYIIGVARVGGGGAANTGIGVGAAGNDAVFDMLPIRTKLNSKGNAGAYGSGGKGSGANATMGGGASVYQGHGQGQGCSTSEYAARRYWINGTNGFVQILTTSKEEYNSSKVYSKIIPSSVINFKTIPDTLATYKYHIGNLNNNKLITVSNAFVVIDAAKQGWNRYHKNLIVRKSGDYNIVLDKTLFESSTAGTYTVNIEEEGFLEMRFVGAGGGGAVSSWSSGDGCGADGGSGGYSRYINVPVKPGTYTVTVGAGGGRVLTYEWGNVTGGTGGESFMEIDGVKYYAGGGEGGWAALRVGWSGGFGGYGNVSNGKRGNWFSGYNLAGTDTASVYGGYGKGGAGAATNPGGGLTGWCHNGYSGYAQILFRLAKIQED